MSETLEAIYDGHQVGTLSYAKDRLTIEISQRARTYLEELSV